MSAIQLFDLNGEQRFTGTSVGGGGAQPLTLLGPYTVTFAQLDPVSAVFLVALAPGTVIVRPLVIVTTPFTALNESVSLLASNVSEANSTTLIQYPATADKVFLWGTLEETPTTPVLGGVIGAGGAHLLAQDGVGGNTAGVADCYCLVKLPT